MAHRGPLVTPRLVLRGWTEADREPFAAMNADPVVMEYFPSPMSRPESDAFVHRIEAVFEAYGFGLWVVERLDDGVFLGFTGLAPIRPGVPHAGAIEVGWRLASPAWGHGYATEAAREALRFGFVEAGLEQIVSLTAVVNGPSRRVMERLGMHHDPVDEFDHPAVPSGRLRRHVLYRLRRTDWRPGA